MATQERLIPDTVAAPGCAFCDDDRSIYRLGDGSWLCIEHIGLVVSLAANDVYADCVSYFKAFEDILIW